MATSGMILLPRAPQQPTFQFNEQYRVTLQDGSLYQCTYNPTSNRHNVTKSSKNLFGVSIYKGMGWKENITSLFLTPLNHN